MDTCLRLSLLLVVLPLLQAQTGPFSPEDWPTPRDPSKIVHYVVTDGGLTPPGANWTEEGLRILSDGDQVTQNRNIGGHVGKKVIGNYLNVADSDYAAWQDEEFIDILVQVYGDQTLFTAQGNPRNYEFLTGCLPELASPVGGQIPVEANNKRWNWFLFRIPNGTRGDGTRFVGSVPAGSQGNTSAGGVNGGTIRFQNVPGITIRVIAFGQQGAFGEPADVNLFLSADFCEPEPPTNLVGIDFQHGTTNHLTVLNDGDQTVSFSDSVGPAGDKRRVVTPNGTYLNFGISDLYLGKPCNDPRAMKLGVEFYDAPEFAGMDVRFGPEAYATDDKGGTGVYPPEKRQVLTGSGKWIRRSWTVPAVNLKGVNTGTLTGGPRLISENGQVSVSAFYLGILRTGTNALAGQDPLSDWYEDPNICTDAYGSFAELDLAKGTKNGLDVGSSQGDQEMVLAEAGPTSDRRNAIRPAREDGSGGSSHQFLNFAITDQALGPSTQPPALLAICATYYDDPALVGKRFRPEVYVTEINGVETFGFTTTNYWVTLEGTDKWREAYWEIGGMKFIGVNQAPQAAARFVLEDKIFFTSLRYGVIRPCGPNAGVNPLQSCKPKTDVQLVASVGANSTVRIAWPASAAGFILQSTLTLGPASWSNVDVTPTVEGEQQFVLIPMSNKAAFFRLTQ